MNRSRHVAAVSPTTEDTTEDGFPSMIFKVRNIVWYEALCTPLLFVLVVVVFPLDEADWKVGSGRSEVGVVGL